METEGNESAYNYPLSDNAYYATGVYLSIVGCLAVVGNLFVILVLIWGKPNFIKAQRVLMLSIASSDLTVACTSYPITAAAGFYKRWVFGDTMCVFTAFAVFTLSIANINALTTMSIIRYIVVCRQEYLYVLQAAYPKYILLAVWGYALFWTVPPLVGWSNYQPEPFGTSCTLNWRGGRTGDTSYNTLTILFCYILHVITIIYCYRKILKEVSGMHTVAVNRNMQDAIQRGVPVERILQYRKVIATRRMAMVCFGMITGYLVCWTPYAVMTAWNMALLPVTPEVQLLPCMFAKASCLINPIIYAASCDRFREAAARFVRAALSRVEPLAVGQTVPNHSQ